MTSKRVKIVVSFVFAAIVGAILISVLVSLKDSVAWTSAALGLVVGWGAGIMAAPYQSEQRRLEKIGSIVAGFISGYALSKLDRIFDLWMDPARGPLILEPTFVHRTLLFLTSFFLAAIVTYVGRKYVSFGPDAEKPSTQATT